MIKRIVEAYLAAQIDTVRVLQAYKVSSERVDPDATRASRETLKKRQTPSDSNLTGR